MSRNCLLLVGIRTRRSVAELVTDNGSFRHTKAVMVTDGAPTPAASVTFDEDAYHPGRAGPRKGERAVRAATGQRVMDGQKSTAKKNKRETHKICHRSTARVLQQIRATCTCTSSSQINGRSIIIKYE